MHRSVTLLMVLAATSAGFGQNLLENPSFQDPAVARIEMNVPVVDGDTVTIDLNDVVAVRTYEFDTGDGVTPGNILVDVSGGTGGVNDDNAAIQLAAEINADVNAPATADTQGLAEPGSAPEVLLVWKTTGGDGIINASSQDFDGGALEIDDFNEDCRQNFETVPGWEGMNNRRNGDVFIPQTCLDGEHLSLQGSGGSLMSYQTVTGVDPAKSYLFSGVWTLGDYTPACEFAAELHDGTDPDLNLIAETIVTLTEDGKYNWLPFSVVGSPTGTDLTVVLRATDSGGDVYALHADNLSLEETNCTPPTVDSFDPPLVFTDTVNPATITGTGFVDGQMSVRLEGDDVPDIPATNVAVQDPTTLTCDFDIPAGSAGGARTVVVELVGCGAASLGDATEVRNGLSFINGSFELLSPDPPYAQCPYQPQTAPLLWEAQEIKGYGGLTKLFRDEIDPPFGPLPFSPSCPPPDGWHFAATISEAGAAGIPENFIYQTFVATPGEEHTFTGYFAGTGNNRVQMEIRDGGSNGPLLSRAVVHDGGGDYDWTFNAIAGTPPVSGDGFLTVGWRVFVTGDPPHGSYGDAITVDTCTTPPTVDGTITPASGEIGSTVQITGIPGTGFTSPQVLFRLDEETTIVADNVQVTGGGTNITCEVDLTGAPNGLYDVIIVQDNCFVDDLANAFEVLCPVAVSSLTSIDVTSGLSGTPALAMTITGTDLDALTGIKLVRGENGTEIPGVLGAADPSAAQRDATFDLTGAEMGYYDVVPVHPCLGVNTLENEFLIYLPAPANLSFETGTDPDDSTEPWCDGLSANPNRAFGKSRPLHWEEPMFQTKQAVRNDGVHLAPCPLPDGDHFASLSQDGGGGPFSIFQTFAVPYGATVSVSGSFTGGLDGGCDPHNGVLELVQGGNDGTLVDSSLITNANGGPWQTDAVSGTVLADRATVRITLDLAGAGSCVHALHMDNLLIDIGPGCNDPFADADGDGDVDQGDLSVFQHCLSGTGNPLPVDPIYCVCFDRPEGGGQVPDGDVDNTDYQAFEDCASGAGVPADPTCDD